ncbi:MULTISPECIES: DUF2339 domain-containing protein [Burkholderia]|uniref:DUF2339 domain-containing protein n=1 Tax=Burkholderia TaxID=32008 RepID=UPI000757FE05|nr:MULTISPECIES: DUF2339 domain-containing protein [Burkholderia]KVH07807.1 hypothetical protein WS84_22290 [Burkholderia anthina]KVH12593.1 hypothetical protein WS85_11075 [Burkholderia anthina]KVM86329.1 hypothetical protein WT06_24685 [Burkholderia anthina]KVN50480.1 hypothetical protein WT13_03345 [Burkholderia anthina]KVX31625.1 hypothetical protein WT32_24245 [Burkholderia anthina]
MNWAFAVIGFIVGGIAALIGDFSAGSGSLLGAAVGFCVGHALRQSKLRHAPVAPDSFAISAAPPPTPLPLADRVARLEATVDTLTRELDSLRAQLAGAKAGAATSGGLAQAASDGASAPLPAHVPATPAQQPAAARVDTPASASTPAPAAAPAAALAPATTARTATASAHAHTTAGAPATASRAAPPVPPAPREPGLAERAFGAARDWLLGGNTVVRVGIIVLFFGVAFLLKYAADNDMLPIEFRLAGTALAAAALLAIGWRVRARRAAYGLVLQGGGVGILYLTIFAATKLYALLPVGAAFPLMVAICALSAFLAVRQNALPLAFMGSAGGFLAPILLSTGQGNHVALFSYYALLNAGIFAIAWFKAWRPLNLLGFVFTFTIGSAWGVTAYRPALFASTEPFLVLFFLMYVGIALLYAVKRELALRHYVDGTLVFGTPIVATALQASLVKGMPFALAWSAVALSAFYVAVAASLARRRDRLGLLFESMLALAVIFATLAVPLAFSGPTTSAAWAIEGAAVVWLGVRQKRLLAFGFGLLMQLAAAGAFFTSLLAPADATALPVLNGPTIAMLLIALAGLFTGWWLHGRGEARAWHAWMPEIGVAAAAWGLLWWVSGGLHEILVHASRHVDLHADRFVVDTTALFAAGTAWLAHATRHRLAWPLAEWPALALTPVLALLALRAFDAHEAPLSGMGAFAWPLAVGAGLALLWRQSRDTGRAAAANDAAPAVAAGILAPLHTLTFWTLCGLLSLEGFWRLHAFVPEGAWSWSAWAYGFGALLLLVSGPGSRLRWPVAAFPRAYQVWGAAPLAALLWLWSLASTVSDGDAAPLFWLPLLNPLDVAQGLVFVAFAAWLRRLKTLGIAWHPRVVDYAAIATVFLWFNALMLRTLHHRFHLGYDIDTVVSSFGVQQVFMVGWSLFAFAGMWLTRRDGIARLCAFASLPLIVVMWAWTFYANFTQDGGSWARVPLFNPLDLVLAVVYALAASWFVRARKLGWSFGRYRVELLGAAGATGFLWLNAILLRTLHHWAGVPYEFRAMAESTLVQASVSVYWTVCALAIAIWATRRGLRPLWFVGAALLALTVVKLFLFDLSHVTGIERIVSFIGIGVLLLLIGYFSPLPPKAAAQQDGRP